MTILNTRRYEMKSYLHKNNAKLNLSGRTHYVDDDTLRFHYARITSTAVSPDGLLFGLVESVALDPNNRMRGFRHVIFDITGFVITRPALDHTHKKSENAYRAMMQDMANIDRVKVTADAIARTRKEFDTCLKDMESYIN